MPEYFDTATLAASFDRRIAPGTDLLDLAFTNEFQSQSEKIVFDEIQDDEGLAAYVSPTVETPDGAHPIDGAKDFKPSYIKERHTVKPAEGLVRKVGESLLGDEGRNAGDAFEQGVERIFDMHQNRITRREIFQANQLIQSGKVTIVGENYPERIVNFNRDAQLSDALLAGDKWGGGNTDITDYIEAKSDLIGSIGGAIPKVLILGSDAKSRFVKDEDVREALDNTRAKGGSMEFGTVGTSKNSTMRLVGEWGDLTVFKYVQTYKDKNGVRQHMFPTDGMALLDPAEFFGFRCYGAILDRKADLMALKRFPKVWDSEDPAVTLAMTQSSPLMVSGNINSSFFATV